MAERLRSDVPGSLRAFTMFWGEPWHWRVYEEVMYSVKTGKPASEHVLGVPIFKYFTGNPEAGKIFADAMTSFTSTIAPAVLAAYDFSSIRKIVDVAGGHGLLANSILKGNPGMRGILFDLPAVVAGAKAIDRCELMAGDFFESVPAGDAYVLKHIIHDWDDERAIRILKNCRRAMEGDGKLLLVETVIPAGNEPSLGKILDLEMLLMPGGRERTEAEYRDLYAAAGFRLTRIIPTQSPVSVIEGVPEREQ